MILKKLNGKKFVKMFNHILDGFGNGCWIPKESFSEFKKNFYYFINNFYEDHYIDIIISLCHGEKYFYPLEPDISKILANGGSCIAGPDGEWVVSPVTDKEGLIIEIIDFNRVLEERQNFDAVGHYSRPDVTQLIVNRERQSILKFKS